MVRSKVEKTTVMAIGTAKNITMKIRGARNTHGASFSRHGIFSVPTETTPPAALLDRSAIDDQAA